MLHLDRVTLSQGDFSLSADFKIPKGERLSILGPSGAGKSTLLSAIAGFLQPTQGRIMWDGTDLDDQPPGARPTSILFQDNNLFPHLTVAQNVGLGVRSSLRLSPQDKEQVRDALHRVELGDFADRKPAALSGGQQSRVALARVLVQSKPIILLDEPFAALGPSLKAEMLDLVLQLSDALESTVMMVTHDPDDAIRMHGKSIFVADNLAHTPIETNLLFTDPPDALRNYLK